MKKKFVYLILAFNILTSIFLNFYKQNDSPPCMNADEVAYGYNAYSVLKTGKDEYGKFLPLRFKSFEDYKLPLYGYLSIPFIKIFGLNEFSTRLLNKLVGIAYVPMVFLIATELFGITAITLLASTLASAEPWIFIMTRHAHEGELAALFTLTALYFLIRYMKKKLFKDFVFINISLLLLSFSYHTGRIFLLFFAAYQVWILMKDRKKGFIRENISKLLIIFIITCIPFLVDLRYGANRVQRLFFTKNVGFQMRITEYLNEHPLRIMHNKLTEGIKSITNNYFGQLSPDFFFIWGDRNWRFGFNGFSILTPVEYLLFFVGLYYFFRNKFKYRWLILFLFLITPLNNALTWQEYSLIRTYFLIFPIIFTVSYGVYHLYLSVKNTRIRNVGFLVILSVFLFFIGQSWDFYFFHYSKRAAIVRAWQCGYKEVVQYVKANYNKFDTFVMTERYGQPYIFFLYYLQYPPEKYQTQAKLSIPDEYGFGEVEKFDKFRFKFKFDPNARKTSFIGYPDQLGEQIGNMNLIKTIKVKGEEIFWIYEAN